MLIPRFLIATFSVAVMMLGANAVSGQNYPNKPIRILSTEAGGVLDIAARVIAQEISAPLGQPVLVENRASTIIPDMAARATPDGYTVSMGGGSTWLTPLIQKTSYDPIRDLAPITSVYTFPYILVVNSSVPVKSVKDLIDLVKAKPGVLNIAATASPGGLSFLAAELFKATTGVNMVRVAYKSNASALIAVLAGEAQLMFNDPGSVTPHVKSGKLRALAVASLEPTPLAPGLPTLAASGVPGFEVISFTGALVPAGTPAPVISRLNREIVRALNKADVKEKFFKEGIEVAGSTSGQFAAKIKSEMAKWGKVLKNAGVKPEL
jgi:tripartite-type tricarboxylate transporter receptor subunit TctC